MTTSLNLSEIPKELHYCFFTAILSMACDIEIKHFFMTQDFIFKYLTTVYFDALLSPLDHYIKCRRIKN